MPLAFWQRRHQDPDTLPEDRSHRVPGVDAGAHHRGVFGALEEWGPGTDVIPTLTLVWLYKYSLRGDKSLAEFEAEKRGAD